MEDKYSAVWVSHSSISDFLACPRAYYLKNVYKDPKTGHKIQLVSPPLSLGQVVHQVLEELSVLPVKERFAESLLPRYRLYWERVAGRQGGFLDPMGEKKAFDRGEAMLKRVMTNPGPLKNLAVKIKMELPWYWLSSEEGIILCGKIDWLEYLESEKAVHIIDFKTGKATEREGSLQLPIYGLLAKNCQQYEVDRASYWYLERSDELEEKELPDLNKAELEVLSIAKKIKLARQLERFKCPKGELGCLHCQPFEKVLKGEAEFVGLDEMGRDLYLLDSSGDDLSGEGEIL